MRVSASTRISDLIRMNAAAIEAIASVNRHFEKLKNPLLRKLLAPRVNIAEAAAIGKCSIEEIFRKLEQIGFEVERETASETAKESSAFQHDKIVQMDVRPLISEGKDPFQLILQALKKLAEDETLLIINSFEPVPLIRILSAKGYRVYSASAGDKVHTFIKKNEGADAGAEAAISPAEVFDAKLGSFGENLLRLDVSALEMPGPMLEILKALEHLPGTHALLAKHRRIPHLLLPELKLRNAEMLIKQNGEAFELLIFRR